MQCDQSSPRALVQDPFVVVCTLGDSSCLINFKYIFASIFLNFFDFLSLLLYTLVRSCEFCFDVSSRGQVLYISSDVISCTFAYSLCLPSEMPDSALLKCGPLLFVGKLVQIIHVEFLKG